MAVKKLLDDIGTTVLAGHKQRSHAVGALALYRGAVLEQQTEHTVVTSSLSDQTHGSQANTVCELDVSCKF